MNIIKSFACASALAIAGASVALAPAASAQSRQATATANLKAAVVQSKAYQDAAGQITTYYKADIDALQARAAQLQAEIQPLVQAYNTAVQQPNATQASVRPAAEALQLKRQQSEQEIARMRQRISLAEAYVGEQIELRLETVVRSVMKSKKVDVVLPPEATIIVEPYVDITTDIIAELNRTVPSVNYLPPADYQPGSLARAAAQAAQPTPPAQPTGR